MTYALIDNASLTAVQRVLGQIEIKNPDTINGDLVAFENVIQAILFYDDLICIDNYKTEFQEIRKKEFNFIRFLSPSDWDFCPLEKKAKAETSAIKPVISGGEFANQEFKELLNLLKLNIICTWDLSTSVYYLTMKMLGQPNTPEYKKYGELCSTIYNELSDSQSTNGYWSKEVELIGSDGTLFTKVEMEKESEAKRRGLGGTTKALDMFIASLNWLAYKSIYYSLAAKYFKADTFLHPIRHAFQMHWMKNTGAYGFDFSSKLVKSLSSDILGTISSIIDKGRAIATTFEIPVFSSWLISQTGNVENILKSAIEIKNNIEFQDIRSILKEVRIAFDEKGLSEANKIIQKWESSLQKTSKHLINKYGIKTNQGIPLSRIIKVFNFIGNLKGIPSFPEFEHTIPLPSFLQSKNVKSFSILYKNVAKELTNIERMGGYRDLLASNFKINYDYYVPPKTEEPKYRSLRSDWKIPM